MGGMFDYTQKDFWGAPWYPYWSLIVMSIFLGFVGGDHFFLRSPLSGILKMIVNICTFGLWYFYDLIQIFADKDSVMTNGLSAPLSGGLGIGKGMFTDGLPKDTPTSKAPFRYLLYMMTIFLPFGFDAFIAGDSNAAFARFLTFFIPLLWPIGFFWGCFVVGKSLLYPKMIFNDGTSRFFPFSFFMDPVGPSKLGPKDFNIDESCATKGSKGFFSGIIANIIGILTPPIQAAVNVVLPGVQPAIVAGATAVEAAATAGTAVLRTGAATADLATSAVKAAVEPVSEGVGLASTIVQKVPGAVSALPETADAVASSLAKQSGGGLGLGDGPAFSALFVVLMVLMGTGAVLGFLRVQKQIANSRNGKPSAKDDSPPKPHVF